MKAKPIKGNTVCLVLLKILCKCKILCMVQILHLLGMFSFHLFKILFNDVNSNKTLQKSFGQEAHSQNNYFASKVTKKLSIKKAHTFFNKTHFKYKINMVYFKYVNELFESPKITDPESNFILLLICPIKL